MVVSCLIVDISVLMQCTSSSVALQYLFESSLFIFEIAKNKNRSFNVYLTEMFTKDTLRKLIFK